MSKIKSLIAAAALISGLSVAGIALAQNGPDPVLAQARTSGVIGEGRDGYVAIVDSSANADIQARVQSLNTRRRAAFTRRATNNPPATVEEMAIAFACEVYATQISPGELYQAADGSWQTRTSAPPPPPSATCTN